jgi:RNA polymerase sigma factor (sigma-70 family)
MSLADHILSTPTKPVGKSLEQLQAALSRYCLSLTESSWDAEDLAQDTWLKALGTLTGIGHTNPEAYLLRIAKNTWIDQSRRNTVLARILKQEWPKASLPNNPTFEIEAAFQALMKHLSPLQRTVFLLRDVFGYSNAEAAAMLRTTEGAVKAALHRARHSLNSVKEEIGNEALPSTDEDGSKAFLKAIATAYQSGDIPVLVELAQRDAVEPAVAIAIVQNQRARDICFARHANAYKNNHPTMRMAA